MANKQKPRSEKEIEADLAATRERLARTVDELTFRVSPGELKRRGLASLQAKVDAKTKDENGAFRMDLVAYGLAGLAGTAIVLGLARRMFHQGD
ncbi:DUF3618 domain-containing protein [Ornithinimicrobium sp. Arc0846-15]|nr:DUF3618 domain-containing protein [Ornithinimicrobium laminariae]